MIWLFFFAPICLGFGFSFSFLTRAESHASGFSSSFPPSFWIAASYATALKRLGQPDLRDVIKKPKDIFEFREETYFSREVVLGPIA